MKLVRLQPDEDGYVDVPDTSVCHELTHDDGGNLEVVSLVVE
jgi:hypothetical protein